MSAFKDSQEAGFRRLIRDAIRKGEFTKSERDVTLAIVNMWFFHRSGQNGFIYPGRGKLAVKAKVSVVTVKRTLAKLRAAQILKVASNPRGGWGTTTRYTVDAHALLVYCGCDWIDQFMTGRNWSIPDQNDPHSQSKMTHTPRVKMTHGLKDTSKPVESEVDPEGDSDE